MRLSSCGSHTLRGGLTCYDRAAVWNVNGSFKEGKGSRCGAAGCRVGINGHQIAVCRNNIPCRRGAFCKGDGEVFDRLGHNDRAFVGDIGEVKVAFVYSNLLCGIVVVCHSLRYTGVVESVGGGTTILKVTAKPAISRRGFELAVRSSDGRTAHNKVSIVIHIKADIVDASSGADSEFSSFDFSCHKAEGLKGAARNESVTGGITLRAHAVIKGAA